MSRRPRRHATRPRRRAEIGRFVTAGEGNPGVPPSWWAPEWAFAKCRNFDHLLAGQATFYCASQNFCCVASFQVVKNSRPKAAQRYIGRGYYLGGAG